MLIWSREIKKNKNEIKAFIDENKILWEAQILGAQQNHFFFFLFPGYKVILYFPDPLAVSVTMPEFWTMKRAEIMCSNFRYD